jgi:hypothetical protein
MLGFAVFIFPALGNGLFGYDNPLGYIFCLCCIKSPLFAGFLLTFILKD